MAGPSLILSHEFAFETDTGRMRRSNQDAIACDDAAGVYVVCDGMGGVAGGEVASRLAADTFVEVARRELAMINGKAGAAETGLRRAVAAANRAVRERASFDTRYRGMGTTLVGFRLCGRSLTLVNVGDSRAYLVRAGKATCLTTDHSYVAEQVRLGMMTEHQASTSSLKSVITRAIGVEQDVTPDVYYCELAPGDAILLTTDGLTRHLADPEIGEMVHENLRHGPAAACHGLIECANERGGSDNITCLLLSIVEPQAEGEIQPGAGCEVSAGQLLEQQSPEYRNR